MAFTVFVVGAGASVEYGVPLTRDLPSCIRAAIPEIARSQLTLLDDQGFFIESRSSALEQMCEYMSHGDTPSIDAFLDTERGKEFAERGGLQALGHVLVKAERKAIQRLQLTETPRGWHGLFFRTCVGLSRQVPPSDWAVVTFNYDRLLEYSMSLAIEATQAVGWREAWNGVKLLPIFHVYGSLGPVGIPVDARDEHWKPGIIWTRENATFLYDVECVANAAWKRRWIRLASERGDQVQQEQDAVIQSLLRRADRVVFLGFGFDEINVRRRLRLRESLHRESGAGVPMMATAVKLGDRRRRDARKWAGGPIEFVDVGCDEVLGDIEW